MQQRPSVSRCLWSTRGERCQWHSHQQNEVVPCTAVGSLSAALHLYPAAPCLGALLPASRPCCYSAPLQAPSPACLPARLFVLEHSSLTPLHAPSPPWCRYHKVIEEPRDLETISADLAAGKYRIPAEVEEDIELVFENCRHFNEDDAPVVADAAACEAAWRRLWKAAGIWQWKAAAAQPAAEAAQVQGSARPALRPANVGAARGPSNWVERARKALWKMTRERSAGLFQVRRCMGGPAGLCPSLCASYSLVADPAPPHAALCVIGKHSTLPTGGAAIGDPCSVRRSRCRRRWRPTTAPSSSGPWTWAP